jgi:hypothetical protein
MDETAEQVTSVHASRLILADGSQPSVLERRLQQAGRPVRSRSVVVLGMDPKELLEVARPGTRRRSGHSAPTVRTSAPRTGSPWRPDRRHRHLASLGADHVVEAGRGLRVPVADQEPHPGALFAEHHQQVAGLLGDPGAVGVGGHPGQVDPSRLVVDEAPHLRAAAARSWPRWAGRTPGSRPPAGAGRLPGGGCSPWCRVEPLAAQRRRDRGRRHRHAKPPRLALIGWYPRSGSPRPCR